MDTQHSRYFPKYNHPHTTAKKIKFKPKTIQKTVLGMLVGLSLLPTWGLAEEPGITDKEIRIGASMQLEGDLKALGQSSKQGVEAALVGQSVQKHVIKFEVLNDFYDPAKAVENTKQLVNKGIFAMVNSSGTPTTRAILPILAEHKVPAFGFFTGAGFTGPGDVLNFRAPYVKEVEAVIDAVLAAGVKPTEICAYVQNDGFGDAGLKGVRSALAKQTGTEAIIAKLDELLKLSGDNPARNGIGPVGFYPRDALAAQQGYDSLKKWEKANNTRCRFIVTVAVPGASTNFMGFARYKNESWVFSTLSLGVGAALVDGLREKGVTDKVIATQVVPLLDSTLPVVADARKALGAELNYTSLESYIIGKLFVAILQATEGPLTRENFLKAARRQPYDIGGVKVDFTTDNQGSDLVTLTGLRDGHFVGLTSQDIAALFK